MSDSLGTSPGSWHFWIDRGGTFTDLVARRPDGSVVSRKLLSNDPRQYEDAAVEGIRRLLAEQDQTLETARIAGVRMGTTVATNALLERRGTPTLLVTNRGFGDLLTIGHQTRPRLFDRHIRLPQPLHSDVLEVDCRVSATGRVLREPHAAAVLDALRSKHQRGLESCAIALLHGDRYPAQEQHLAQLARQAGFEQISLSHEVSPLIRMVGRGDTTVADAYLTPVLQRYVRSLRAALGDVPLQFMQSNGGLVNAEQFRGRDAVLSGPAGGIVGMSRVAEIAGFDKVIGFDMGGTSTDVCHYAGEFERRQECELAEVRLRAPMLDIHTVAAGGGSVCWFDGVRQRVGPQSAGADPGPACYRNGGPLTITDCNLVLGRLQPSRFPRSFGADRNQALDPSAALTRLREITQRIEDETGTSISATKLAEGFVRIANQHMARAIKKVSLQRGHDPEQYVLNSFGGAGGQHACAVSQAMGIRKLLVHPMAGVLSAYGMGLAERRSLQQKTLLLPLEAASEPALERARSELEQAGRAELQAQQVAQASISCLCTVFVRYVGSDQSLPVRLQTIEQIGASFETEFKRRFGFLQVGTALEVESLSVEAIEQRRPGLVPASSAPPGKAEPARATDTIEMIHDGQALSAGVYIGSALCTGQVVAGPALICEDTATTVVNPGWEATIDAFGNLILEHSSERPDAEDSPADDPAQREIFNTLFVAIAEQMGEALRASAHSVNIKERLDYSCALFDPDGALVANAPHIPVHLGSMGDSVRAVLAGRRKDGRGLLDGDCWMLNAPYNGGTHLPDITVICPVFDDQQTLLGLVAARGHHADVGGIAPGSMPANSEHVEQEGILIDDFLLVDQGRFREAETRSLLGRGKWPARNPDQNIADLRAQLAACAQGAQGLRDLCRARGKSSVHAYMRYAQDSAAEAVVKVTRSLQDCRYSLAMDGGAVVSVRLGRCMRSNKLVIDFEGTSTQQASNFNAPVSVCRAAVLYVLRMLVDDDIPLNDGCLRVVELKVPANSLLNPSYPAAVVAGNVETSQVVVDVMLGALGLLAGSQGTMNNFSFGNRDHQYYETLCGGSGAGPDFDGSSAVHTHMTNSRLTDVEILETRLPVTVEAFSVRRDSGGQGQHRGGDGVIRRFRFHQAMSLSLLGNHRNHGPKGLSGGQDGKPGQNLLFRAGQPDLELPACMQLEIQVDDCIEIRTPGGGGFGSSGP